MTHGLTLRLTVIGGEREDGDYTVWREERPVGRIRASFDHVSSKPIWNWNITVPLPMGAWTRGSAESMEAAKDSFRDAWERFYVGLSQEQIDRWHRTADARKATDR